MTVPVVLLSTNLARGGAETEVAMLAISLRRRGWPVTVVSLLEPTAFESELTAAGVPLYSLRMKPGRPNLSALARFLSLLRELRPRVIHSHLFHANLLARIVRLVFPVPVVISTLHSMAESSRRSPSTRLRDSLYRLTDALSDATVAVCEAVVTRHASSHAISRDKTRIIPNAVDTAKFRPDPARRARARLELGLGDEFVWLAAGRLMWKKDYPTMLRAAALRPSAILFIAGSGPLEPELTSLAKDLGVNARFLGSREDLPDLMTAADGFVLSSRVEGLPLVLLEAAASGLLCVSSEVGGASEAVLDGRTGFLAPPGNPDALAAAMSRLEELPLDARREMGAAARELALARFDIERVTAQWEQLYLEL